MGSASSTTGTGGDDVFATFATTNRIDWPGPNTYRSASGAPGPDYWQQRADYTIAAALDTRAAARQRHGHHPLHQQLARHAALRLAAARPEPLPLRQQGLGALSRRLALGRARLRGRLRPERRRGERPRRRTIRVDDTMVPHRPRRRPIAPSGGKATITHDASRFRGAGARLRPHGPRRHAVRDRAVVSAHGRLRRHPRVEHRSVPRTGRVLPRVRRHRLQRHRARRLRRRAAAACSRTPARCSPRRSASASRARATVADARRRRDRHADGGESRRADAGAGTRTWRFRAQNVRDVAWAGRPRLPLGRDELRTACSAQAYYQFAKAGKAWESGAEQTAGPSATTRTLFFPYPYPQAT